MVTPICCDILFSILYSKRSHLDGYIKKVLKNNCGTKNSFQRGPSNLWKCEQGPIDGMYRHTVTSHERYSIHAKYHNHIRAEPPSGQRIIYQIYQVRILSLIFSSNKFLIFSIYIQENSYLTYSYNASGSYNSAS